MNIRKYFIAINCTLSRKAFVFNSLTSETRDNYFNYFNY